MFLRKPSHERTYMAAAREEKKKKQKRQQTQGVPHHVSGAEAANWPIAIKKGVLVIFLKSKLKSLQLTSLSSNCAANQNESPPAEILGKFAAA